MSNHVFPLDPTTYQRHAIHSGERQWAETNCYVDVWIELLHAWGFEPIAALPFTLTADFEGDQWTFFKFPHVDLYQLFGLEIQELMIWRPLVKHLEEQVSLGRPVLVELDSYYLPDTAGTAYQREHMKSTVAVIEIDPANQHLGYFHGQGYYHLSGDDFAKILHLSGFPHPSVLPPYVEIVKRSNALALVGEALTRASVDRLKVELHKLPAANPFHKFKPRFEADLQWLANEPIETFHQYSFATLRQFGACYELSATYLKWLQARGIARLERAIDVYEGLSSGAKTMQFQLARAMARKRTLDLTPIDQMATQWQLATDDLKSLFLLAD
ncbi:DUF1839 family protein [Schlesneria paludicola]|uniref:DUF1839 family protein n=1 Tax=Schlesneria paludicola TaxID=360056 RepID=UPI00029A9A6D|nr:DUF1839 family protein [Schlesneria paludicola]